MYMAFYSYIFSANYKGFKNNLKRIAKKKNKNYYLLLCDTYYSIMRYGVGLTDYLNYEFYNRKRNERKEYAGIKIQNSFYETVSPSRYKKRYTIKPNFLKEFAKYTKRDFIVPENCSVEEFKDFIRKHDVFMSKPYDGLGGADVQKMYRNNIQDVDAYFLECKEQKIFLEELVKQHKDMNKLCDTSCNTIRIVTFNNHGKPEILWAGLRIGNGINSVDNFHAGGMGAAINMETGELIGPAIDKDLNRYDFHPTTHTKFDHFKIPYFEEAKNLVKEAALESDKILVVGWDIAITDEGPLIIEGNRRPGFDLIQVLDHRGRKDIMQYVLKNIKK